MEFRLRMTLLRVKNTVCANINKINLSLIAIFLVMVGVSFSWMFMPLEEVVYVAPEISLEGLCLLGDLVKDTVIFLLSIR